MSQQSTDPRSPVQPGRTQWWLPLVAAAIAALAFWTWRQADQQPLPPPPAAQPSAEIAEPAEADLVRLFSADDYPQAAIRREEQGTVAFKLAIDARGRVSSCTIVRSSGSAALDKASCSILSRRARFDPARDTEGQAIADTYEGRIRWELPE